MTDNSARGLFSIGDQNSSPLYRMSASVLKRTTWKNCWTSVQKSLKCSVLLTIKIKSHTYFLHDPHITSSKADNINTFYLSQ
jgi:hypothetical protein